MCPACIGAAALVAGSAITSGGIAALVIKKFHATNLAAMIHTRFGMKKENLNGH